MLLFESACSLRSPLLFVESFVFVNDSAFLHCLYRRNLEISTVCLIRNLVRALKFASRNDMSSIRLLSLATIQFCVPVSPHFP